MTEGVVPDTNIALFCKQNSQLGKIDPASRNDVVILGRLKDFPMAQDTKKTPSARERLLSRARERFPDRTFAEPGAAPQEGVADLDDAINEMLEDYATRQATYDENNARLSELLRNDPTAAEFLQKWIDTGDPRTALVEIFGDDLGMSEEGRKGFQDQLASWRRRRDESKAADEKAESNYNDVSLPALEEWGNKKGLSIEQKRDVMIKLIDIAVRGAFEGLYTEEDFEMAWNGINHDTDVAAAREEGQVAGRNERIAAARRDRSTAGSMPPASAMRQGGSAVESKPKQKSFWGQVNER